VLRQFDLAPSEKQTRSREITRDNTEPHQNANQQEENIHPPEKDGKGNETDPEHINNLGTCPVAGQMILTKKREPVHIYAHYTLHTLQTKTCSSLTHIGRADAHSIPNQNPYPYVQKIHLEKLV